MKSPEEITNLVVDAIQKVFTTPILTSDHVDALGLESLDIAEVCLMIETKLEDGALHTIRVPEDWFYEKNTVAELAMKVYELQQRGS